MSQQVESSSMRSRIANRLKMRKLSQGKRPIIAALAVFIVLGVAVALMQNGMAAQHEEIVLDCHYIGEVAHTHDKSCYNADGELVCPLRERELHKHTDACYDEDGKLICDKEELSEEHVHGEGCFKTIIVPGPAPDDASDTDSAASDASSTDVVTSDSDSASADTASDNAAANTPDGVAKPDATEPAKPEQTLTDSIKDADGKTLLRVDARAPEGALPEGSTMTVVSVDKSDVDKKQLQDTVASESEGKVLDFQAVKIAIKDAKGTVVIPDKDLTVTFTSSLLGEGKDAAKLVRITPAEAEAKKTNPTAEIVDLFGEATLKAHDLTLEANQVAFEASRFSTFVLATVSDDITMRATPDGARVRVDAPAAAGIPAGSTLQATEIAQGSDEYDSYRDEALKAASAKEAEVARFFDIKILGPDGSEIQPAEPVRVRIKLDDAPAPDATPEIVHFADEAASAERIDDVTVDKAIADFDAQSFSVYGVVYTVDFAYDVDGEHFETSVKGGEVINLKNLLLSLKVAPKDDLNDFVADIQQVTFSNEDLVKVIKVDEDTTAGEIKSANNIHPTYSADLTTEQIAKMDAKKFTAPNYALVSLKPFDTPETLTITMANGDVFTIAVTDDSGVMPEDFSAANPNRLTVHAQWRSVDDLTAYPEVRFTLYQGAIQGDRVAAGQPYDGGKYSNIPLNTANNYTWECPEELPAGYGYYIVESFSTESGAMINQVDVYQNSTSGSTGAMIPTNGLPHAENQKTFIYDYYNSVNSNHAKRQDQNPIEAQDGGITSNKGEIFMVNRQGKYIQMDISKKWLLYSPVDGSLMTLTSTVRGDIVMKAVFMRREVKLDAISGGSGGQIGRDDNSYLDDGWKDYGVPFYVGYAGGDNTAYNVNSNSFEILNRSDWLWDVNDEFQNQGLPGYGYRTNADGSIERVRYRYIIRELGIYKNANEDPVGEIVYDNNGNQIHGHWEYMADLLPAAWDGEGGEIDTFPPIVAQDQDRLANKQSTNLTIKKSWDHDPSGVQKVYIKLFRKNQNGTTVEDVTNKIGVATTMMSEWGYVDDPSMVGFSGDPWNTDLSPNPGSDTKMGGYFILDATGSKSEITVHGLTLAAQNVVNDPYEYWIQEIGYRDATGQDCWIVNQLNPRYSHQDSGNWTSDVTDATQNKIVLGEVGENHFRVTNTPSADLSVKKLWVTAEGYNTFVPFTRDPAIKHVLYKIKQTDSHGVERYITFTGQGYNGTDLVLQNKIVGYGTLGTGEFIAVQPSADGSATYQVIERNDTYTGYYGEELPTIPWTSRVHGLQQVSMAGGGENSYTYSVEEVGYVDVNDNVHPTSDMDWSHIVTQDGPEDYTITNSESNLVVKKQWLDGAGQPADPNEPWDSSLNEVEFAINQVRATYEVNYEKYHDYDSHLVPGTDSNPNPKVVPLQGLQNLKLVKNNKVLHVQPTAPMSDTYTITSSGYQNPIGTEATRIGADDWGLMIYGLEKYGTTETPSEGVHIQTQYSYEIVEKPIDNCITTYDPANDAGTAARIEVGGTATIKNQRESVKITVSKTFAGLDDVLDGLTTDDIRDDYDSLSADVKKLLEGITLKLINADSPLPAALNGNGVVFEMTLKQLVQLGMLEYDDATLTFSGTIDKETSVAGVNVAPLLPGSKFELSESGQDAAAAVPTGFHFKGQTSTADPTNKIPTADEGKLSLGITNTYEPQIDIKLYKVDSADRDKPNPTATLKGAEFELWKYKETTDPADAYTDGLDTSFGTGGKLTVTDGTTADGIFDMTALKPGHYELHETKVPAGYIMMAGTPRFEIKYDTTQKKMLVVPGSYMHDTTVTTPDPDDVALVANVNGEWRIIFANPPGSELPHAGGAGTLLATIAGTAMVAAATLYLYGTRKRRKAEAHI